MSAAGISQRRSFILRWRSQINEVLHYSMFANVISLKSSFGL
jgi:hypothetical protein